MQPYQQSAKGKIYLGGALILLLLLLCSLNHWLLAYFSQQSYLLWYSHTGPIIALTSVLLSAAWGDLDKNTALISANPFIYTAACLQIAGLPLIAAGAHLKTQHRITALKFNIIPLLLITPLIMAAMLGWLLLVVPAQYFVFLITGAFSRAALSSRAMLVANIQHEKVEVTERQTDAPPNIAAGEWDASMRSKPFTLTNAFSAALLYVLGLLLG